MIDPPTFSVIVPTYNRPDALTECLAALASLDYPHDRFEVIVVDDGGEASLNAVLDPFRPRINLTLLRQLNLGPGAARNTGAAAAKHEYLAFTDDDCRPRSDWLLRLADALKQSPQALIGGLCVNAYPRNLCCVASQTILDVINSHFNCDHDRAVFFPSDNIALSREMFFEIGGFNSAFRCSEDRDLCDRWVAKGWRLAFRQQVVVEHARVMGLIGFCKQHFGYGRGAWRFHRSRELRGSGSFEVDGNFYLKCFAQPWRTHPVYLALPLSALLFLWQVMNTAGFFYEKLRRKNPAEAPKNAAAAPANSTSRRGE